MEVREPLNKSLVVAALVFRDELREASRAEWLFTFARRATKQIARKTAPRMGLHDKMPICCVALLGIVVRATTFVARLASEHFSCKRDSRRTYSEVP